MLKIRDNVDIEKLLQFGFTDSSLFSNMILSKTIEFGGMDSNIPVKLEIKDDRTLNVFIDDCDDDFVQWVSNLDVVYDLIEAGLVEKVVDDMTDFEEIVISAERYALGRRTYIVKVTVDYILDLIDNNKLSRKCLRVIEQDIIEAEDLGMECDEKQWHKLLKAIEQFL